MRITLITKSHTMKKNVLAALYFVFTASIAVAQLPAKVNTVVEAEKSFNALVAKKGMKEGFLAVADPDGIVFRPKPVKITDFYANIQKQAGSLSWTPKIARISYNGDLAFTAGPYVYQNGKTDDDKVYGDYVSVWRADGDGKLKLLIDLGIQHPEAEKDALIDFKEPDAAKKPVMNKDPFNGKTIILATDKSMNQALTLSSLGAYKEFLSPEGRYYFPGFEPMTGSDRVLKFLNNEAISISAENISGGRSTSNDLAYTYGRARIKKGNIVSNFNYVRIWELDATHKWNILLEVFSAIEN
jgi:ketosteroid isomerase-like protein